MIDETQHIVFFDGYCGLCDRAVTLLFRLDKFHVLSFAPLQGVTAQTRLLPLIASQTPAAGEFDVSQNQSIIFLSDRKVYTHSEAVIRALSLARGKLPLGWVRLLLVIPPRLRDSVYRLVARHRYRIFGKRSSCRLPSPDEKKYFLP